MPLYEFVLREAGRPDEHLISDRDGLQVGDEVTIRNRIWIVVAVTGPQSPKAAKQNVLMPKDASRRPRQK
jgi:hypothetical protein